MASFFFCFSLNVAKSIVYAPPPPPPPPPPGTSSSSHSDLDDLPNLIGNPMRSLKWFLLLSTCDDPEVQQQNEKIEKVEPFQDWCIERRVKKNQLAQKKMTVLKTQICCGFPLMLQILIYLQESEIKQNRKISFEKNFLYVSISHHHIQSRGGMTLDSESKAWVDLASF